MLADAVATIFTGEIFSENWVFFSATGKMPVPQRLIFSATGKMPIPQNLLLLVEQASCLFIIQNSTRYKLPIHCQN
jgi:hypothetical protein